MAERTQTLDTLPCSTTASLITKQFYAVSIDSNETLIVANAANACHGILQDKPVIGDPGVVCMYGVSKAAISASQTLTAGTTTLEVDTGGTLKVHASGVIVARARQSLVSVANVTIVEVDVFHVNSGF